MPGFIGKCFMGECFSITDVQVVQNKLMLEKDWIFLSSSVQH